MTYTKTNWIGAGQPGATELTSARLNKMEQGIADAVGAAYLQRGRVVGGGTVTLDTNLNLKWTGAFRLVAVGEYTDQAPLPAAYYPAGSEISMPPPAVGVTVYGHQGAQDQNVTANGITLSANRSLFFNPADGTYHIVWVANPSQNGYFDIPPWWIFLAYTDTAFAPNCVLATGHVIRSELTSGAGYGAIRLVNGELQGVPQGINPSGGAGFTFGTSGWRNWSGDVTYQTAQWEITPDGWVQMWGLIDKAGGSWVANDIVFSAVAAVLPAKSLAFSVELAGNGATNTGRVDLIGNAGRGGNAAGLNIGNVFIVVGAAANPVNWLNLNGVTWKIGA